MKHGWGVRVPIGAGLVLCGAAALAAEQNIPVLACDTLVALRLLMAEGDRDAALARLPAHPGCRVLERDRVGLPEHRAMIGGSPFECLTIKDEAVCAWVYP